MKLPCTLGAPAGKNVNEPAKQVAPTGGEAEKRAMAKGTDLLGEGREVGAAPYDVGEEVPGATPGEYPEHRPAIPFPPARNAKAPFRFKE
jgi:hypothetical protein